MPTDYILVIPDGDTDDILGRLYLTGSTGSVSHGGAIEAYFDSPADRDAARDLFAQATPVDRARIDWLRHYEQSLQPLFIGESFVVAPDARLIPPGTPRHALVIPQEQAFGTGSHETTSLCIELLETLDLNGKTGLDIGSGSGILALAMRRLGARKVIAFDNDLDAYAALYENPIRNRVDAVPAFIGGIDSLRERRFDVVTMNILPDVILALMPAVRPHLGGVIVVSGILIERRDEIAALMPVVEERTKGEWWAAILAATD